MLPHMQHKILYKDVISTVISFMSDMKIHCWMHLITRISLKKSIEVHFNRSKIFLLYHYYANDVNMRKKNSAEIWLIHAEKMSL